MKKAILALMLLALLPTAFAQKDNSAREFVRDTRSPLAPLADITENFDDITNLPGWVIVNNSNPVGTTDWFQGNPTVFNAHMGANDSYIGANFNATSGSEISNWLLTPVVDLSALDSFSFFTRTATPGATVFPDRVEIRVSTNGASTDVGTGFMGVGDFTNVIDVINPDLTSTGYPSDWTEFSYSNLGLSGMGRIAFRYYVDNAGPVGANSNYIGIDTFVLDEVECTITSVSLEGNQLTIEGNCAAADIYCFDSNNNPVLIAEDVAVNGSATITITVNPDSLYGAVIADGDPANAVTTTTRSVPTLGEWGLIIFVVALMSIGLVFMRKRRLSYDY